MDVYAISSVRSHLTRSEGLDGAEEDPDGGWRENQLQRGDCGRGLGGAAPLVHVHQDTVRQGTKDLREIICAVVRTAVTTLQLEKVM